jgi:hypothetical protein
MQSPLAYALAGVISVAVAVVVPSVAYVVGIVVTGDLGGPLNLILVPLLCGGLGLAITALLYVPVAIAVERLVARFRFHRGWPAVVAIACAVLLGALLFAPALAGKDWSRGGKALALFASGGLCVGFAIYWSALGYAATLVRQLSFKPGDLLRLF